MVERYLIRKSLLKSLQEYQDLNHLKVFELKSQVSSSSKDFKNSGAASEKDADFGSNSMAQTPRGAL